MTPPHRLLEVAVRSVDDAHAAQEGGADRVEVVGAVEDAPFSPEPDLVAEICRTTDLAVRARLRLREGYSTDGGEIARLHGLAWAYAEAGAEGMTLGFLTLNGEIDVEVCDAIVDGATWPWTFHEAVDDALDPDRAWAALDRLPRLDQVLTAGSPRGVDAGLDEVLARAQSLTDSALLMAGGALKAEHLPWLLRGGVGAFHLDTQVRRGGDWDAPVDADVVASWRRLLS